MLFHTPSHGISTTLSKVLSTSDPWHIGPLTFGILNALPMVSWTHYPCYIEPHIHGISNPYPWYFEPPTHGILISLSMLYWTPIHGISNPLSMVIWTPYPWYYATPTPYPWYIKPHIHDISNILPMVFWPPNTHSIWTPYPWNIEHPTHGISILLSMVYQTPSHWYFDLQLMVYRPPTNGILNSTDGKVKPLPMEYRIP